MQKKQQQQQQQQQRQRAVSSGARKQSARLPPDVLRHLEGFRLDPDDRVVFFFLERFQRVLRTGLEIRRGTSVEMTFLDNAAGLSRIHLSNRFHFHQGDRVFTLEMFFNDGELAEQMLRQSFVDNEANHDRCLRFLYWVLAHIDPAIIHQLGIFPPPPHPSVFYTERRRRGESIESILQNNSMNFRSNPMINRMLRSRYGGVVDVPQDFFLYTSQVRERLRRLTVPQDRDPTLLDVKRQTRRLYQQLSQQTFATRQEALAALRSRATHDIVPESFEAVKTGQGRYKLRLRETAVEKQLQRQRRQAGDALFDDFESARAELDRRLHVFLDRVGAVDGFTRSHAVRAFQDALGIVPVGGRFRIAPRERRA